MSPAKMRADNSTTSAAAQSARTNASMGDLRLLVQRGELRTGRWRDDRRNMSRSWPSPPPGPITSLESSSAMPGNYMIGLDFPLADAQAPKAYAGSDGRTDPRLRNGLDWQRTCADQRRGTREATHESGP